MVALVADSGWKYLSTGAWTGDLDEAVERANRIIYF
jgi:cysteine synthase B